MQRGPDLYKLRCQFSCNDIDIVFVTWLPQYIMPRGDADREREARQAANLIYSHSADSIPPHPPVIRVPSQANGVHPAAHTNGQQSSDSRKLSASRRVFCLLATFDLLLTAILWFIYVQVRKSGVCSSKNITNDIHLQLG